MGRPPCCVIAVFAAVYVSHAAQIPHDDRTLQLQVDDGLDPFNRSLRHNITSGRPHNEWGVKFFNTTYTLDSCPGYPFGHFIFCSPNNTYRVFGFEPAVGTGHPVYFHISGGFPSFPNSGVHEDMPEMFMVAEMARRGFVAALAETPQVPSYALVCNETSNLSLNAYSRMVFGWNGAGDIVSNSPLSILCRRSKADCNAGIALHGHSLGGLLSDLAPRYARGVTGLVVWGAGSRVPFGDLDCCGLFSGGRSCCEPGSPVGGSIIPCVTNAETSLYLPPNRRRLLVYWGDQEYGDCYQPAAETPLECNKTSASNPAGSIALCVRDSGYDCGESLDCIQPDGSGYYIPSLDDVGEKGTTPIANGHNFHNTPTPHTDKNETIDDSYMLNKKWVQTTESWGMKATLDWLAATARRKLEPSTQRDQRSFAQLHS